ITGLRRGLARFGVSTGFLLGAILRFCFVQSSEYVFARQMEESFCASDGSLLRLIPAGNSIFGSSLEEIEYAIQLDKESELFSLDNERPQFEASLAAYYIGVYTVSNEQFARFLSET